MGWRSLGTVVIAVSARPFLVLALVATPFAGWAQSSIQLTIRAPEVMRFDLALDEVELQWTSERPDAGAPSRAARGTAQASVVSATPGGNRFSSVARTQPELTSIARSLEAQNPGSRAYLVLYEAGQSRQESSRRLLGTEVAVLLTDDANLSQLQTTLAPFNPRLAEAVPRAFVVEAADPLGSLELAAQLSRIPGVKTAYPLLRQRMYPR
jgi:hypothetical protein